MRLIILLAITVCASWLVGCRSQQISVKSCAQAEKLVPDYVRHYKTRRYVAWVGPPGAATYLRRRQPGTAAIVRGHISELLATGKEKPLAAALVVVDGERTSVDEAGNYVFSLVPGRHQVWAGTIGFLKAKAFSLRVERGYSIYLSFCLLQDPRPLID